MTAENKKLSRRKLLGMTAGAAAAGLTLPLLDFAEPAQAAEMPANPLDKSGWVLDRHDEFNGSLDTSLWITRYLESRTTETRARAWYGFRNNALVLRIDDNQPTYYSDNPLKVSSIQTGQKTGLHKTTPQNHTITTDMKYTPKYGYFEIRAKTCARSGLHAAFWAVGRQDTASQNGEIDIIEDPGPNSTQFLYNLHKWDDPGLTAAQVIAACRGRIADYKIPKAVRFVAESEIPRSAQGKIRRHELEAMLRDGDAPPPRSG